jgi:hypothetical protein
VMYINQTYVIADQPAMSEDEWFFITVLGIALFVTSTILSLFPWANEVDAMLSGISTLPLFISAFSATAIDKVTSYGVTSMFNATSGLRYWALLENHTIYHYDITGIFLWAFSFIAVLNTIRMVVNHKRIERLVGDKQ